jgi:hypothetical protein
MTPLAIGSVMLSLLLGSGTLPAAPPERFVGGMLGVSADVQLCYASHHALVKLTGVPLGGTLEGKAEFAEGGMTSGDIVVHEPLKTALRRRFVTVVSAAFVSRDEVHLVVKLPLLLGTKTIILKRVANPRPSVCGVPFATFPPIQ